MAAFKRDDTTNWTEFRKLPNVKEVDFHRSKGGWRDVPYWDAMADVERDAFEALKRAYEEGRSYLLLTHGWSTSIGWSQTTSRSVIRAMMRSPKATPYIIRSQCVQHRSCFVAAIRPKAS